MLGETKLLEAALTSFQAALVCLRQLAEQEPHELVRRQLGQTNDLLAVLNQQGRALFELDRLDEALAIHGEQERFAREAGNKSWTRAALYNQGMLFKAKGELHSALACYRAARELCLDPNEQTRLLDAMDEEADVLRRLGNLDEAAALNAEHGRLCQEANDRIDYQVTLSTRGAIQRQRGDRAAALASFREEETLARKLGNSYWLADALLHQASLLVEDTASVADALRLAEDAHELIRTNGLRRLLQRYRQIVEAARGT